MSIATAAPPRQTTPATAPVRLVQAQPRAGTGSPRRASSLARRSRSQLKLITNTTSRQVGGPGRLRSPLTVAVVVVLARALQVADGGPDRRAAAWHAAGEDRPASSTRSRRADRRRSATSAAAPRREAQRQGLGLSGHSSHHPVTVAQEPRRRSPRARTGGEGATGLPPPSRPARIIGGPTTRNTGLAVSKNAVKLATTTRPTPARRRRTRTAPLWRCQHGLPGHRVEVVAADEGLDVRGSMAPITRKPAACRKSSRGLHEAVPGACALVVARPRAAWAVSHRDRHHHHEDRGGQRCDEASHHRRRLTRTPHRGQPGRPGSPRARQEERERHRRTTPRRVGCPLSAQRRTRTPAGRSRRDRRRVRRRGVASYHAAEHPLRQRIEITADSSTPPRGTAPTDHDRDEDPAPRLQRRDIEVQAIQRPQQRREDTGRRSTAGRGRRRAESGRASAPRSGSKTSAPAYARAKMTCGSPSSTGGERSGARRPGKVATSPWLHTRPASRPFFAPSKAMTSHQPSC